MGKRTRKRSREEILAKRRRSDFEHRRRTCQHQRLLPVPLVAECPMAWCVDCLRHVKLVWPEDVAAAQRRAQTVLGMAAALAAPAAPMSPLRTPPRLTPPRRRRGRRR